MSKPKYWWYSNVVRVIRNYPALREKKNELQGVSLTARLTGLPGSGNWSRGTERAALRELPPREESDLAAVERAMEQVSAEVMEVVRLYHWQGVRNFETVGDLLHMGRNTAKRRNGEFVRAVAYHMGYLETEKIG